MVALTFDDGPHPKNTPRILETLRTYDEASTFFMVGTNVVLNYLLIFGKFGFPALGISGAAIGSSVQNSFP